MKTVNLKGENLTLEDIINVSYNDYKVCLTDEAKEKVKKSGEILRAVEKQVKLDI